MTTAQHIFRQAYSTARKFCRDRAAGAAGKDETGKLAVCPIFTGRVMGACGFPVCDDQMVLAANASAEVLALERYRAEHPTPTLQQRIEILRDDVYPYN